MTKFEDQLLEQLMIEHGDKLRAMPGPAPAPARRRVRRPVWLATGAAGAAAAVTAGVMALGSAPALAAYSVTRHDGTVSVTVNNVSGVRGANTALQKLRARVVVVPVKAGCPSIDSLPKAQPGTHPATWIAIQMNSDGHRSASVRIKGTIPAGDTMILAFSGNEQTGSVGVSGIITGPVPSCVSLSVVPGGSPPAPPASGGSQAG
jgi:hypothetical protein